MPRRKFRLMLSATAALFLLPAYLHGHAQDAGGAPGRGGGQFAGAQRVAGEVLGVAGANISVKNIENGQTFTVVTTTNTRLMKGPGEPLDLAGLKAGDGVVAMGQLDPASKSLHAVMVMALSADQTRQMEHAAAEMKANLGKTYIAGRVTAVDLDNLKMTVQRPDGQAQTIGFDEGTSFKRGGRVTGIGGAAGMGGFGGGGYRRGGAASGGASANGTTPQTTEGSTPAITGGESITLADIKVGDSVIGLGSVKAGTFVPGTLNVQVRGEGRGRRGGPEGQSPNGSPQPAPSGPGER